MKNFKPMKYISILLIFVLFLSSCQSDEGDIGNENVTVIEQNIYEESLDIEELLAIEIEAEQDALFLQQEAEQKEQEAILLEQATLELAEQRRLEEASQIAENKRITEEAAAEEKTAEEAQAAAYQKAQTRTRAS